jgi:hypothetical protein
MYTFKIYHYDDGKEIIDMKFEAESREVAYERLCGFISDNALNPADYFYKEIDKYILNDNGTKRTFDSMHELMEFQTSDHTWIDDIRTWFSIKSDKIRNIKYIIKDIVFWWKNYNSFSSTSHMRSETWSLDHHMINDLAFNIPIFQKNLKEKNFGIADYWCLKARDHFKETIEEYVVSEDLVNSHTYTNEEMSLATEMWNEKLDELMKFIGKYEYLNAYGHLSDNEKTLYRIDDSFNNIIPYYPGTEDDIDYKKLQNLIDNEWNNIWDWIKEYGRMLWT